MGLDLGKIAKGALELVAPLAASALPGPLGSIASGLVKQALGTEDDDEVERLLAEASPETMVKLKGIDADLRKTMRELDIKEQDLYLKDTQSARTMAASLGKIWPQFTIFACLTLIIAGVIWLLFNIEMPEGNRSVLFMVLGNAVTAWLASIYFFTGTTKGSQDKNRIAVGQ